MQSHPTYRDSSRPLHLLLDSLNIVSSVSESHPAVELWNVDVMHIIMSYADRRVISSLMKTCNALNSAGTKYLLAIEDEVCFRRKEGLVSFIRFLQARGNPSECSRRLKFLTKLNLEFNRPTEHVARILECLFEFLAHVPASNFTSLKIWDVEALLASHPPLGVAIANLSILKTLDFLYAGEHCAVLLRTLQSNLTTVKIHFGHYCREQEGEILAEPDVNPIMLLEGSQSTLQYLSASFSLSSPDGPRYPNTTHLELSCTDFPYIEHYIRAFPNLQSLTSFECTGYGDEDWHERREMAMLYQTQYGTWQSLRHFQGSLLILWVWGLTCRIPSVRLTFEQQIGVNPNFLNDIILDVRPSELALRLLGASSLLDDAVRAVLSEEGRLQGLELCLLFHVNESDGTVSVAHILDLIIDVVRTSSVSRFKLILDLSWMKVFRGRSESDDGDKSDVPLFPFEIYVRDMDVDAYADNLFASVTSLKEVQVSVMEDLSECTRQVERRRREPDSSNGTDASASSY